MLSAAARAVFIYNFDKDLKIWLSCLVEKQNDDK